MGRLVLLLGLGLTFGCTQPAPIFGDASGRDAGPPCAPDYGSCGGPTERCESFLSADDQHCGSCTTSCSGDERCVAGECATVRPLDVGCGFDFTCVLLADGQVLCFGLDDEGQLGDAAPEMPESRSIPAAVTMLDDVTTLEVNGSTSCVIRGENREVFCWGSNRPTRFGDDPRFGGYSRPIALDGLPGPAAQLVVGGGHTCVIDDAGALYCSGGNANRQLGFSEEREIQRAGRFEGLPPGRVRGVAPGGVEGPNGFTIVLMEDGKVYCVGTSDRFQCGSDDVPSVDTPVEVALPLDIVQVVAGVYHACALTAGGDVYCWGANDRGQIADGTLEGESRPPTRVAGLPPIERLRAQFNITLAFADSGHEVFGWGGADDGQFALPDRADQPRPVSILYDPVLVFRGSPGPTHLCYVAGDVVHCTGDNRHGQLGRDEPFTQFEFAPVPFFE